MLSPPPLTIFNRPSSQFHSLLLFTDGAPHTRNGSAHASISDPCLMPLEIFILQIFVCICGDGCFIGFCVNLNTDNCFVVFTKTDGLFFSSWLYATQVVTAPGADAIPDVTARSMTPFPALMHLNARLIYKNRPSVKPAVNAKPFPAYSREKSIRRKLKHTIRRLRVGPSPPDSVGKVR